MKILITGGTGLIGRKFIHQFPQHSYTVLTRSAERAKQVLPNSVSYINNLSQLANLNDFDAVINLAGEPIVDKRWSEKQKRIICSSRCDITEHLVNLTQKSEHPPVVILSGSAIGIYGDKASSEINELQVATSPDFASNLCERWEAIAQRAVTVTRVVNLRTGVVLDPEGGALSKMLLPFKFCLGGKIGSGAQYMSWIHIQDMLNAMHFLLENNQCTGPFNMTSPNPVTNQQFTQQLSLALHRIAFLPVPAAALKLLMGESSSLLLGSQRVIPEKLNQHGFGFGFTQLNDALTDLLQK